MEIRNLVFDLGGVIIDLKRDAAVEALEALGIPGVAEMLDPYCQRGIFLQLETGLVTAAEFYDYLRGKAVEAGAPAPTDVQIQDAFNAFLVRLPVERLQMLRRMRERGFRVYALSNTNPVMYHSWIADAFGAEGLMIDDYFDGIVTSFQQGRCKPDPMIFKTLTRRYSLRPEETLMLDDSPANCRGAEEAGLNCWRVKPAPDWDLDKQLDTLPWPDAQ